ncbi:MAG: right-handed parallel beta-helix repeat-containing protein, partial [Bacteroidales bacterium]|nr:right-handed parallel beta-helix repeat-containing protein [Bacteroidales bacterium]
NPNNKVIKAAKNGSGIHLENKSYITIRNLQIQNCEYSVQMREASHNNIIENCYFRNGGKRVYIFRGANNTIIRNNEMTMDYYAGDSVLGAGSFNSYRLLVKRHVYDTFKYTFGPDHSDDIGIYFRNIGNNTVISGNYIHGGLIGISGYNGDYGFSAPANGMKILNNKVHNMASVGITSSRNVENMEIYNNLVYDCNLNFRLHELNRTDEVARSVCLYGNVGWNPPDAGVQVFMHFPSSSVPKYFPTYRIYNNVFVGGWDGFNIGSNAVLSGGMPKYSIFNNMMLAVVNIYSYMRTVINNGDIELIDYNVFGGIEYADLTGTKFGANNVFFAKTYDYLDFETIDQFLTGFNRNTYAIDQMDIPEELPNHESTWLVIK